VIESIDTEGRSWYASARTELTMTCAAKLHAIDLIEQWKKQLACELSHSGSACASDCSHCCCHRSHRVRQIDAHPPSKGEVQGGGACCCCSSTTAGPGESLCGCCEPRLRIRNACTTRTRCRPRTRSSPLLSCETWSCRHMALRPRARAFGSGYRTSLKRTRMLLCGSKRFAASCGRRGSGRASARGT